MKKFIPIIFVSTLLLLHFNSLMAESVSVSEAETLARKFFSASSTKASSSNIKLVWPESVGKSADSPYFIFNSENSFVIVAGDDAVEPVIGYSTTGLFDPSNIPDGLKDLLESHRRNINFIRGNAGRVKPAASDESKFHQLVYGARTFVKPEAVVSLNTALWGQGSPYNNKCPVFNGQRCLTGCGATAIAILMKYYEYPSQAYGPIPGYTSDPHSIVIPAKDVDYQYQWDLMKDDYESSSTEEQESAVATLMADLGQILQVGYDPSSTWAYTSMVLPGMLNHMKYSKKGALLSRVNYSSDGWAKVLRDNLDAGHPVLYRGDSEVQGGHFYILDGYDTEGRFHFNWGWEGYSNGFFFFPDTDFSSNEDAIVGLVPDERWMAPTSAPHLSLFDSTDKGCFGLWLTNTAYVESGKNVEMKVAVTNNGTGDYSGEVKVCLRHSDNTLEEICLFNVSSLRPYYYQWKSFGYQFSDIVRGDELVVYYTLDNQWVLMDEGSKPLPLRYRIEDVLSLKYFKDGCLEIRGMAGMTMTCPNYPSGVTFYSPVFKYNGPITGDYTFSNGHESYTVHLTF